LVLDPDYFNYVNINNPKARGTVQNIILELYLIDCWHENHLEYRKYIWLKKNTLK